ncbi:MAG TPA: NAD(P)-dependent oxidoreductase [Dokdonella sp.]
MKIALFGANGHLGGAILQEALQRGHEVVAVVRDPQRLVVDDARLTVATGNAGDSVSFVSAIAGCDVAVASLSGRRDADVASVPRYARVLLDALPQAGVRRLIWVGGAGSLEVSPGVRIVDDPAFPPAWKPEALAQAEALQVFRATQTAVDWTYISPAAVIEPGERSGRYRVGGDQLLVDANGASRITIADYAAAVIDRVEKDDARRTRITVAY